MAIWTGMREGELFGLMWSDIDFDTGWLHISRSLEDVRNGEPIFGDPKTDESERDVPLSPLLLDALREHGLRQMVRRQSGQVTRKDYGLVFTQKNGGPIDDSNFRNRYWYPLLKRAGLRRLTFHQLRHTAATVLHMDLGYEIKTVQELLGHTDPRTTEGIYVHVRNEKVKEAVSRMDSLLTAPEDGEHDD